MSEGDLEDTEGAMESVDRYIVGRVPPGVEFKLLEPCRRCYTGNQQMDAGGVCLKQV